MAHTLGVCIVLMAAVAIPVFAAPSAVAAQGNPPGCRPTLTALRAVTMRRTPNTRGQRLATLNAGNTAHITARTGSAWYQVLFNNQPGWVPSQQVSAFCNANVPVVPAEPVPPVLNLANFVANPAAVSASQCSTLSWSVSNVAAVYFVENDNAVGVAGQANRSVCPSATTQYGLLVRLRDNSSFFSITSVLVTNPAPGPNTANFRANPTTVAPGQCSTLSWNVNDVAGVFFTDGGNTVGVAGNASRVVCPQTTTQYSLLVRRNDGTSFNSVVVVTVSASQQPNFRADNATINAGQCTNLRWNIDNVAGVFLITGGNVQGVPGNFTQQVCPTSTTTYVLRVQRRDGSTFDTPLTITVNNPSAGQPNFRADNGTVNAGQCTTLRWEIDNVRGVWFWDPVNRIPVGGRDARQVCPGGDTTYRLEVQRNDGSTIDYYLQVNTVNPQPQPPGPAPTAQP